MDSKLLIAEINEMASNTLTSVSPTYTASYWLNDDDIQVHRQQGTCYTEVKHYFKINNYYFNTNYKASP